MLEKQKEKVYAAAESAARTHIMGKSKEREMTKGYYLGLYEKSMPNALSMREKLSAAKECGFDHLEMSIDETAEKLCRLDWSDGEINEVRTAIYDTSMPIRSICLSGHRKYPLGHPDPGVQKKSLEIMSKAITLAAKLGIRLIQIAGYDVYYEESTEETEKLFEKNLRLSVEMAAREGVILAFETMETAFLNNVEKAMYWVDRESSPYLQVYPDVGNVTNALLGTGVTLAEDMEKGKGHIVAVHLKETKPGVYREVPYGAGNVDFDEAVRVSRDLGVKIFLAEFWYLGQEDWMTVIKKNGIYLRKYLDKYL